MASPIIVNLIKIQATINDYFIPIVYFIGTLTNIFNLIIFGRRKLRRNCCSRYFICLSLSQILLLNLNFLLRSITSWTHYDGFSTINSLCKIRSYFSVLSLVLVRHFICIISIDRWLVTSSNIWLRRQSSLKNVRWIIISSFLFWILFSIHAPIAYISKISTCSPIVDLNYAIFSTIYNISTSSAPFFIVIIFSTLTIINIRQSHQRITPVQPASSIPINARVPASSAAVPQLRSTRKNNRDMHFIRLAIFQVIPYLFLNFVSSFSPIMLYLNSISTHQTTESTVIFSFIHYVGVYLSCLYVSVTVLFYVLASSVFRKEFLEICKQFWFLNRQYFQRIC
ncbi:hypothetical protein I4U23_018789 [Adineta vaga]|nr:hypothetical protein I4U23_018789 [Adineta vaga]